MTDHELPLVRHTEATTADVDPDCELFDWRAFADNGLLWALNRYVLHPQGLACVWFYPDAEDGSKGEEPSGWQIVRSDSGIWNFDEEADVNGSFKYRSFLAYLGERPGLTGFGGPPQSPEVTVGRAAVVGTETEGGTR